MNWLKEIKRIDLDFMEVDHCSMVGYYQIGKFLSHKQVVF